MQALVNDIRVRILTDRDGVCLDRARLVTEAWQRFEHEPMPLRRARAFAHILGGMTLDLQTNPVFAGNTTSRPRAWMMVPEYSIGPSYHILTEDPHLVHLLDGDAVPTEIREFWKTRSTGGGGGVGHLTVRYDLVVDRGLEYFLDLAGDEPAGYRQACRIACQAVIDWAHRYAEAADVAAAQTGDPVRAAALRRMAAACRRVPGKPARNLFEALQSILLVHFAVHIEGHTYSVSPGLLDRWLARFANEPEPELIDLLSAFLLKFSEVALWGSHVMGQPITLGGTDAAGRDQCNRLTLGFLEACRRIRMPDPYVFIRWHAGLDERVKELAARMLAEGVSFPLLSGDAETRAGLEQAGIRPDDAAEYVLIGCNELGIPGKLISVPMGSTCELQLLRNVVMESQPVSMDETIRQMQLAMQRRLVELLRDGHRGLLDAETHRPTPFTSALMDGCLERNRDLHGELTYTRVNIYVQGFTNLINSLAAIDQVVFRDRTATMAELASALRADFAGAEPLRQRLLAAPKWGNDNPVVDAWAARWLAARDQALTSAVQEVGCARPLYCHVVRSMHISHGKGMGATPDGRHAGDMLADSIGAPIGTMRHGPTAVLNSVRHVQARRYWTGGYNLNLTLPAATPATTIRALADAFLNADGQELQINAIDPDTLREAQASPERYPDLAVRIAGYNAHFCRLTRKQQDELVARAEDAAG